LDGAWALRIQTFLGPEMATKEKMRRIKELKKRNCHWTEELLIPEQEM
jgi:hypothetical protein